MKMPTREQMLKRLTDSARAEFVKRYTADHNRKPSRKELIAFRREFTKLLTESETNAGP